MATIDTRLLDELDAVNYVLGAIGRAPINTLEAPANRAVTLAIARLSNADLEVQAEGWSWNTFYNFIAAPNINGQIELPDNTMSVAIARPENCVPGEPFYYSNYRVTMREDGGVMKLFNMDTASFQFDDPISIELRQRQPFESIPMVARLLIAAKAAIRQNSAFLNDRLVNSVQEDAVTAARLILEQQEDDSKRANAVQRNTQVRQRVGIRRRRIRGV